MEGTATAQQMGVRQFWRREPVAQVDLPVTIGFGSFLEMLPDGRRPQNFNVKGQKVDLSLLTLTNLSEAMSLKYMRC